MSIAGAIRAGAAYVEILADNNPLTRGLATAKNQMQTWSKSLKGIGGSAFGGAVDQLGEMAGGALGPLMKLATSPAGAFAGFLGLAKMAADSRSALDGFAKETGVSVEAIGSLKYAAEQTGLGLDGLSGAIFRIEGKIAAAAEGEKAASEAFQRLGLNAQAMANMLPDEQLREIAVSLANITDKTQRASAARELLGKGGGKMLPFMMELSELEERYKRLGMAKTSQADAEAGEEFNRTLGDLTFLAKNMATTIGGALLPQLQEWAAYAVDNAKAVRDWIREHKGLIETAFKVSAVVTGIGGAFMVAGSALALFGGWAGMAAKGFSMLLGIGSAGLKAFSWLVAIPGMLMSMLSALVPIGGAILALLASPVGLVIVALGTAAAAVLYFSGAWKEALGWISGKVATLTADLKQIGSGIGEAVMAGDLQGAMEIAWAGVKLEWVLGVNFLKGLWSDFAGWMDGLLSSLTKSLIGPITAAHDLLIDLTKENGPLGDAARQLTGIDSRPQSHIKTPGQPSMRMVEGKQEPELPLLGAASAKPQYSATPPPLVKPTGDYAQDVKMEFRRKLELSITGEGKTREEKQTAAQEERDKAEAKARKELADVIESMKARKGMKAGGVETADESDARGLREEQRRIAGLDGVRWGEKEKTAGSFGGVGAEQMAGTAPIKELVLTAKEANEIAKRNEKHLKTLEEKVFAWQ